MNTKTDLQTVMQQFLPGYREHHPLSPRQAEVCAHIDVCRTEALGGMALHCDQCDYEQPWYHACRDRHCPKCQWRATQAWCDKQRQSVLPVTYYHLVFTLPHDLNGWCKLHREVIYRLLFKVEVSYKDYRDHDRWKIMPLSGEELIRRFLLHILPKGLMRVRHYGFLANCCRKEKLAKIREVLGQAADEAATDNSAQAQQNDWPCPKCHQGQMRVRLVLSPIRLTGS